MRQKIAIVVQRCHEKLVGGSEALAWQYATLLKPHYDVEILTTAASDYVHWRNDLPVGVEERDGIVLRRFRVDKERGAYFSVLWNRIGVEFAARNDCSVDSRFTWPESLEEEFIRAQGPHSTDLTRHVENSADDYRAVIFITYLYPTTFEAARAMPHRRWLIVPCMHDEPTAYLKAMAHQARRAPRLLWNTRAEQEIGVRLWGVDHGTVVSMTVETTPVDAAREPHPYLLYCGRIDVNKGSPLLLDAFADWKKTHPSSNLELVLTGHDVIGVGSRPGVRYLGFVDEARKFELMAGALAFVQPSPYESLSIVLLEAMAQRVPVIVNGECEALVEHVEGSRSGAAFRNHGELQAAIDRVVSLGAKERAEEGVRARDYVIANYGIEQITARLLAEIEELAQV